MNNVFALIYGHKIDMIDLGSEDKTTMVIPEEYEQILGFEFKADTPKKEGLLALKVQDSDPLNPQIWIMKFVEDKFSLLGMKTIKMENLISPPLGYLLKFTSDLKQVIVSTFFE